jgi:hypothetical protein
MPCDCSPEPEDLAFLGICLAAPGSVTFADRDAGAVVVPVCGHHMLRVADLVPGQQAVDLMVVVARDAETGQVHRAPVVDPDRRSPAQPAGDDEPSDEDDDSAVGGYFNVDLMAKLSLPERSARYEVRVDYLNEGDKGYAKSNVVTVELIREDSPNDTKKA